MREASSTRTTLYIADDVLDAAKQVASARGVSIGEVISELARRGLRVTADASAVTRNGSRLFPIRPESGTVTPEIITVLLDDTA